MYFYSYLKTKIGAIASNKSVSVREEQLPMIFSMVEMLISLRAVCGVAD